MNRHRPLKRRSKPRQSRNHRARLRQYGRRHGAPKLDWWSWALGRASGLPADCGPDEEVSERLAQGKPAALYIGSDPQFLEDLRQGHMDPIDVALELACGGLPVAPCRVTKTRPAPAVSRRFRMARAVS